MEPLRLKCWYRFAIYAFILLTVLLPRGQVQAFPFTIYSSQAASVAESQGSFFCTAFGWLLTPLGFCEDAPEEVAEDPLAEEPDTPATPQSEPDEIEIAPPSQVAAPQPPATTQIIRETPTYVTNEYITKPIEQQTIREVVIRDKQIDSSRFVTQATYDRQVDALQYSVESSDSSIADSIAEAVNTALLTVTGNATVGGTLNVAGATTLDTALDVSGTSTLATTSAT